MTSKKQTGLIVLTALFVFCINVTKTEAAALHGKISTASAVKQKTARVTKDTEACGKNPIPKENILRSESGGLKNAVVEIIGAGTAKPGAAVISQHGCRFEPHVLALTAGSSLTVKNDDSVSHNFHTYAFENDPVNFIQPKEMKEKTVDGENFEVPEAVEIKCDIHEWMRGWIYVTESGLTAVTDADGNFQIENIPPGTYRIRIWHETLGEAEQEINVKKDDNAFNHSFK